MEPATQTATFSRKLRKFIAGILLIVFFIPTFCILIPVLTWVWIPDIWSDKPRVLMDFTAPTQDRFVITEQLTDDFYLQKLDITRADGTTEYYVIDGDGPKIWFYDHAIDSEKQEITFFLNRRTWARYSLKDHRLKIDQNFIAGLPAG